MTTSSIEVLEGDAAVAEGDRMSTMFRRPPANPQRLQQIAEAATIFGRAMKGGLRARADLVEALSTSDFPNLLGAVFGRQLMATYRSLPRTWPEFATRTTVNDFRPKTMVDLLGGRTLLAAVAEYAPYPHAGVTENPYTLKVGKFGKRVRLSWEMIVNDDLGAFQQLPDRLAQGAANTEDYTATAALVTATGPSTAFFKAGNGNTTVTGAGTALTVDSLSTALTAVSTRKDSDGNPIQVNAYILMVPPGLEVIANNILKATQIRIQNAGTGGVGTEQMYVANWIAGKVKIVVNPWIPVIDVSATAGTTWYLLPDPMGARPAVTLAFLRGHETPDLRRAADTGTTVGGGNIAADEGSFEEDDIQYRVRHVLGAATLDPIATYAAAGA